MRRTQISLTEAERRLLDTEAARSGRSISALIRSAVSYTYGTRRGVEEDLREIDEALGAWSDRDFDGEEFVERVRSGDRLTGVSQ